MKYAIAETRYVAEKAWFEDDKICLKLSDQKEIRFPVYLNERLRNASRDQAGNIEIICGGTGLHWPDLDEDLSVSGIMEGRYGRL